MQIKAAIARENNAPLSIEDAELADLQPGEVRVKLVATGICHSDAAVIKGVMPLPLPRVLGHEGAGIVEAVGAGVNRVKAGDHVVLSFGSCGKCRSCSESVPAYCDTFFPLNFSGSRLDGSPTLRAKGEPVKAAFFCQSSFATHAIATERSVVKVRNDAPLELLGPLCCGFQTGAGAVMNVIKPRPESVLLILGAGAVGFAALFAARIAGVRSIIVADRVGDRLTLANSFGAQTINTGLEDLAARLAALGGVDAVVETTGIPALANTAIMALKIRGTCVIIGASADPNMTVPMIHLIPGRTIRGAREGDADPQVMVPYLVERFLEGAFPIDRLTRFYDFADINAAFAAAASGEVIKPIVRFAG